jgi:uncharacterized DUF497 family protein
MIDKIGVRNYNVIIKNVRFEWNTNKSASNQTKHDISFEEAATAFADSLYIEIDDPEHSDNEERFIAYGISERNRLLAVCYTITKNETYRIISARKATKTEESQYGEKTNARRI